MRVASTDSIVSSPSLTTSSARASAGFAARRMDRAIAAALAGRQVDEVAK